MPMDHEAFTTRQVAIMGVNLLRSKGFQLGSSKDALLTVTDADATFTMFVGADGVEGWDDKDSGVDAYELIRRNLFDENEDHEDEVVALGEAIVKAMESVVTYLEIKAQEALDEISAEADIIDIGAAIIRTMPSEGDL
jgi:hypothetical protein